MAIRKYLGQKDQLILLSKIVLFGSELAKSTLRLSRLINFEQQRLRVIEGERIILLMRNLMSEKDYLNNFQFL